MDEKSIAKGMAVIGSCEKPLGVVDLVEAGSLGLVALVDDHRHYVPLGWVAAVDRTLQVVKLHKSMEEAQKGWTDTPADDTR